MNQVSTYSLRDKNLCFLEQGSCSRGISSVADKTPKLDSLDV